MVGKELHNRRLKLMTCNIQELFIFITLCSCATAGANMLLFYLHITSHAIFEDRKKKEI